MSAIIQCSLTSCFDGLGERFCFSFAKEGDFHLAEGNLTYTPVNSGNSREVIDEMGLLLTSGRINNSNRNIIRNAYAKAYQSTNDHSAAFRMATQLMILSAEFHSTGLSRNSVIKRPSPFGTVTKSCKDYKAVVHLLLDGGMDSYNLLVPHSQCSSPRESSKCHLLFFLHLNL